MLEVIVGIITVLAGLSLVYDRNYDDHIANIILGKGVRKMETANIIKIKVPTGTYDVGDRPSNITRYKTVFKCSNCHKAVTKYYNYCPYCGKEFKDIIES